MKKLLLFLLVATIGASASAQGFKDALKKATTKDENGKSTIGNVLQKSGKSALSNDEIVAGLKQALEVGTGKATSKLSAADGFLKDAAIKILMPEEAQKVEKKLRAVGMGKQVDNAITSMNRAAEDAAKSASPIFVAAIKEMSFADALSILRGNDVAATSYLNQKTSAALRSAFAPVIEQSLQKVNATQYWNTVFTTYNKFSTDKVETDLTAYVTEKALAGIFYGLGEEEKKIRKDPMARTTDLLKKVFSN